MPFPKLLEYEVHESLLRNYPASEGTPLLPSITNTLDLITSKVVQLWLNQTPYRIPFIF